jgi:hypothetical protein
MPVFRITNLVNNQNYSFQTATSTVFDNVNYEPWPYTFQKNGSYWKWNNPTQTIDTILLNFYGAYQNLNLGASELLPFGIYTVPPPSYGEVKYVNVSIVSDMVISGSDIFCNNPVTFNLLHMPTSYTSATWEIKQGTIVRASGVGTGASANNLSNGPGKVSFKIHFLCGLKDLTFTKDFWVGTPLLNVTGPTDGCVNSTYYFTATPTGPSSNASNYTWDLIPLNGNYLSPYGYQNNSCAITFYNPFSASGYWVKARAQNTCGTGGFGQTNIWVHTCYTFILSPNPASESVTVTKKVAGATENNNIDLLFEDANTIYTIRVIDYYGSLQYSTTKSGESFTIPVRNLKDGNYIFQIINEKDIYNLQLIVKH